MILRFQTQDQRHSININFKRECYSFGESEGKNYITIGNKAYSDILDEIIFNCFDYTENITGDPEDFHPFTKRKEAET